MNHRHRVSDREGRRVVRPHYADGLGWHAHDPVEAKPGWSTTVGGHRHMIPQAGEYTGGVSIPEEDPR